MGHNLWRSARARLNGAVSKTALVLEANIGSNPISSAIIFAEQNFWRIRRIAVPKMAGYRPLKASRNLGGVDSWRFAPQLVGASGALGSRVKKEFKISAKIHRGSAALCGGILSLLTRGRGEQKSAELKLISHLGF